MSTPQNPYTGSDAENSQNHPSDQGTPAPCQAQDRPPDQPDAPAAGEQPDATQFYGGDAQYGQGSHHAGDSLYGQHEQFSQAEQYSQQNQYDPGAHYNPQGQYGQQDQYGQPGQQGQPGQAAGPGQYYQEADYAQYNRGNFAGSQHPPVGNYEQSATQHSAGSNSGFFKSLFDFRFDNFIAIRWAGIIYIIAIVVAALSWLGSIIGGILTGAAAGAATSYFSDSPSFSPWPLLLAIIFGWIVPALWVIFVRLGLELIVANVKTAENTKKIADSLGR